MKVLVTGGAGYIGSHIVKDLLEANHEVVVLDNMSTGVEENIDDRTNFILGDIHDDKVLDLVLPQGIEAVLHFAASKAAGESMLVPEKYSHNNISGTVNLLNAMRRHDVNRFVFSSTAAVYGNPDYLPIDEKHGLNPTNFYGHTKLEIERILEWYGKLVGFRFAALRYFNAAGYDVHGRVTGKERNPANLLPVVMEVAAGMRKSMKVFGNDYDTVDGTGVRDYIHVNDLASAHLSALEFLSREEEGENLRLNLATGEGYSVLQVIDKAREISGREINYEIVERRAGDPAELYATSNIAEEKLNWKPKYSDLHTLLSSTWEVYK